MNKALKSLALSLLATSAAFAYTNQTTIALRSHGYNLARDYTTFNELVNRKADDKFGANFQVTGFYQGTNSGKELGKYFGMANKNEMKLGHLGATGLALTPAADLDSAYLIHDSAPRLADVTIKFNPRSESYGAAFAYYQDLDKLLKGLYLSVSLPVVRVENDMRMTVNAATGSILTQANVVEYFKGNLTQATVDLQDKLLKGKIDGKRAETGVADIELKLGYNFLEKDTYHLGLNIGATVPTGNEHKADYLFDAIVGNGKHFAIGAGLEGGYRVWGEEDHNIKLGMALDYRYLFEHAEYRTPGLKNPGRSNGLANWGQYHLLGSKSATANVSTLTPAANVITQNCDVTPGSQLEGLANVAYNNGGFSFDLGYNMFWKDKEQVKAKTSLETLKYGIASRPLIATTGEIKKVYDASHTVAANKDFGGYTLHFDGLTAAGNDEGAVGANLAFLAQKDLDYASAATPAVWTHKIYSGFGYSFKEWDTPLMMGVGGSYEFASKNSSPDFWSVFGKLGVAF